MSTRTERKVKVADEVWVATALLHTENASRADFTIREIVDRAAREAIAGRLRPGVRQHVIQHCVANRPPDPGRYRMLFATAKGSRRLFRPGDPYHPEREGAKARPTREEIPAKYRYLVDWYEREYATHRGRDARRDALLSLRGLGKEIWEGVDPDAYVRGLREGWE
jgi:hypothetical protein